MIQMKKFLTVFVLGAALASWGEKQPYERYQTIVDRQPFGQPPAGFNPQQMASDVSRNGGGDEEGPVLTMDQEQMQKALSFSMINIESEDCIMVGFADRSDPKAPRHYYLQVGQSQDGWLVKDCDPSKETMTIEKDGVSVELTLGSNPTGGARGQGGKGGSDAAARPASPTSGLLRRPGGGNAPMSFQGRRARRAQEEAENAALEQERKRKAEEEAARAAEEKAVREQERAEQRQQLMAIQEELRRAREEKARQKAEESNADNES